MPALGFIPPPVAGSGAAAAAAAAAFLKALQDAGYLGDRLPPPGGGVPVGPGANLPPLDWPGGTDAALQEIMRDLVQRFPGILWPWLNPPKQTDQPEGMPEDGWNTGTTIGTAMSSSVRVTYTKPAFRWFSGTSQIGSAGAQSYQQTFTGLTRIWVKNTYHAQRGLISSALWWGRADGVEGTINSVSTGSPYRLQLDEPWQFATEVLTGPSTPVYPPLPAVPVPKPPVPEWDPLPDYQPEADPERERDPLAPPLAPPGTAPSEPQAPPGEPLPDDPVEPAPPPLPQRPPVAPPQPQPPLVPGPVPRPPQRPPSVDPQPDDLPGIGPDGKPVPPPLPQVPTTPPETEFVPGGSVGQPGTEPQPDLQGIAREVAKIEGKVRILLDRPAGGIDVADLLQRIADLLEGVGDFYQGGAYELVPVCETLSDGSPAPPRVVGWPGGYGKHAELLARLDALAGLLQVHKELKQPICRRRAEGHSLVVDFIEVPGGG